MKFDKVQFVYIDMDYLKKLNEIEPEIFFDAENKNYKEKSEIRENDIIVDIKNRDVLNRIPLEEQENYKQRMALMMKEYSFILNISDKNEV